MMSEDFVSIKELAVQLGMDASNARKYVLKHGYKPHKRRTPRSKNQPTLCLSRAEADEIIALRKRQGYGKADVVVESASGYFYVIQLVPEFSPQRLKLGFADNVEQRLSQHKTAAPTAKLLKAWPCKRTWEQAAIDCVTRYGSTLVNSEVFDCENPEELIKRGDDLFNLLPQPEDKLTLSEHSPLNLEE